MVANERHYCDLNLKYTEASIYQIRSICCPSGAYVLRYSNIFAHDDDTTYYMTPWACTQGNKHIPLGIKDLQLYMHLKRQQEHVPATLKNSALQTYRVSIVSLYSKLYIIAQ